MPHILVVNLNDFSICKTQFEAEINLEESGPIGFEMFELLLKNSSQDILHNLVVVGVTNEEFEDCTLVIEFFLIVPTLKFELFLFFEFARNFLQAGKIGSHVFRRDPLKNQVAQLTHRFRCFESLITIRIPDNEFNRLCTSVVDLLQVFIRQWSSRLFFSKNVVENQMALGAYEGDWILLM